MGTQGAGRKRLPNRERLTAEDDALNQIAREIIVKRRLFPGMDPFKNHAKTETIVMQKIFEPKGIFL